MQSSKPVRIGGVSAEWTQELQALPVGGPIDPANVRRANAHSTASLHSIAPVGLDLPTRDLDEDLSASTVPAPQAPRKHLGKIAIGAVGGCALIFAAAGITRVVHASAESSSASAAQTPATATQVQRPNADERPAATPDRPPAAAEGTPPATPPQNGSVHLEGRAKAGHVWIDGKKLGTSSAVITCGEHRVKVGHRRAHTVDVPCGGEVRIAE